MPDLVDVNVSLSRWPFRRMPGDEVPDLVAKLKKQGVVQAWAGSFDGVFHRDIAGANERLVRACRDQGQGLLLPFGSVNPAFPDWEDDLRRCHEVHGMRGVRLHPNYHGYKLTSPEFVRLLEQATERKLIVQLAVSLEDERTQPPLMPVPHVDIAPLPDVVKGLPKLKLLLINAFRGAPVPKMVALLNSTQIHTDVAMLEAVGGLGRFLEQVPPHRVLFGSHYPFFTHESATLKLKESPLSQPHRAALTTENARRLLSDE